MLHGALWIAFAMAAPLVAATWAIAYRCGLADGREAVALDLLEDLAAHELLCAGRPPADVAQRLERSVGLRGPDAARIVARAGERRGGRRGDARRLAS